MRPKDILAPGDLAQILGLANEEAGLRAIRKWGIPSITAFGRKYVLYESLLKWMKEREEVTPSEEELDRQARDIVARVAPAGRNRGRARGRPGSVGQLTRPGSRAARSGMTTLMTESGPTLAGNTSSRPSSSNPSPSGCQFDGSGRSLQSPDQRPSATHSKLRPSRARSTAARPR